MRAVRYYILFIPNGNLVKVFVSISLIHDVNPSQLSGASHRSSLREALLDARRDTVTHRATSTSFCSVNIYLIYSKSENFT